MPIVDLPDDPKRSRFDTMDLFMRTAFKTTPKQQRALIGWTHATGLGLLGGAVAMETLPAVYSGVVSVIGHTTAAGATAATVGGGTAAAATVGGGTAAAVGVSGAALVGASVLPQLIKTSGQVGLGALGLDYMQKNPLIVLGAIGILGYLLFRKK